MKNNSLYSLIFLIISSILNTNSSAAEPLRWAGCDVTKKAFMAELAATYEKLYGTRIILQGGGDSRGFSQVHDKSVEIGGACRSRISGHPVEGGIKQTPIAWDALVVMVHQDNPVSDISLNQLRDLYQGRLSNWKQLGGDDRTIELLLREGKVSGVGRTIRKLVFGDPEIDLAGGKLYPSSEPLELEIESNRNAVAMSGISSARKRNLKILTLEGTEANYDNIRSGEYLLYRPLYITYNSSSPRRKEVKQFIKLANSSMGRKIIKQQGVVPYLEASKLVLKQRDQWKTNRKQAESRE